MAGGNSRDRRKLRRAVAAVPSETNPKPELATREDKTPETAKLIRGLFASGTTALLIGALYEYLSLAGVVNNMTLARMEFLHGESAYHWSMH